MLDRRRAVWYPLFSMPTPFIPHKRLHKGCLVSATWYHKNVGPDAPKAPGRIGRPPGLGRDIKRPCTLQNVHSGRIIKADSIVEFCKEAGLKFPAQYHVTPVLDGARPSFKGWFLPETLARKVDLKDVYDNEYKDVSVHDWLRRKSHAPALGKSSIFHLITGKKRAIGGGKIMLASTPNDSPIRPKAYKIRSFVITNGKKTIHGTSILNAAKKAGLNPSDVYSLAYGFRDQVNGYEVQKLTTEDKVVLTNV